MSIQDRKKEHILNSLKPESQFSDNWFNYVFLFHNSLPDIDYYKIDTKTKLFDRYFDYPIYISGMTGGFKDAKDINLGLAKIAYENNIPMGIGSIRAIFKSESLIETYDVKKCYDVFLIANLGGVQLKEYKNKEILDVVYKLQADALAVHLNPAQELIQKEGDLNWEGVYDRIIEIADEFPTIVKEVGNGISREIAQKFKNTKVKYIDISGTGGTSWTKIEYLRNSDAPKGFEEWGIPTPLALLTVKDFDNILASGGIRSGIDGAKALVLGARAFGMAKPFLDSVIEKKDIFPEIAKQLKGTMFLLGARNVEELRKKPYALFGPLRELYSFIISSNVI